MVTIPEENDKANNPIQRWKTIAEVLGSIIGILLLIDITSGIVGGLGVISFFSLLLIPAVFAFPIIIKTSKLLIMPSVIIPVVIIIIGIVFFHPSEILFIIILFCVVTAILGAFGIGAGFLIRSFHSRKGMLKVSLITVGCFILLTPVAFIVILVSGVLLPRPPMPEITYAEFPFRIEIEHNGERLVFEDTLICEFSGFRMTGGIGGNWRWYRYWTSRFESGREYHHTWPSITLLETDYIVVRFHSGEPAFYMDLPWQQLEHGIPWSPLRPSIFVDDLAMRARGEFSFNFHSLTSQHGLERLTEHLEKFGIYVISIELTPPLENTFR